MLTLAASATHALLSRLLPYQKEIVLSEAQMRLMHIDPKNHPGFKGGGTVLHLVLNADEINGYYGTHCLSQFKACYNNRVGKKEGFLAATQMLPNTNIAKTSSVESIPKLTPKDKGNKPKYPNPFSPIRGNFLLPSPGSPTSAAASASSSPGDVSSMSWTYQQQVSY